MRIPRLVRGLFHGWLAVIAAFVATGPWPIGPFLLREINVVIGAALLTFGIAAASRDVRRFYGEAMRAPVSFSNRTLLLAFLAAALLLLRVVWSSWDSLEVNAWDFTINFDRPIERTLHGTLLYSEEFGMSMLGNHASWLSFAFVPLYAIHATPVWLLLAHAAGIAAAVAAAFALFRRETGDDLVAVLLAGAFLVNRYVAKATHYVYHPEIFYPLGLFVLYLAFLKHRRLAFALALLLLVTIKEDAIIPVAGFALTAGLVYRRWRWAAAALAAAALVFATDYLYVLPHFSGSMPGDPWYSNYWKSFGDTPVHAVTGMIRQPATVAARVATGSSDVFLSVACMPLLGFEWLLAALPALMVYGSADMEKLHWFTLYYGMPVLPPLFAAIPPAMRRIARVVKARDERLAFRVCAALVLAASVGMGAGHVLRAPHPDRQRIAPLLRAASHVPATWIQGAMFPHAGYSQRLHVLNERAAVDGRSAFLLSPALDPYPHDPQYVDQLIAQLTADPRYRRLQSGTLVLFYPGDVH